jgi:putative phage-type endonuclease
LRVITADQGSTDWHQARIGVPSGSKYGDIMAKGSGATRAAYLTAIALERITGVREEFKTTKAMETGVEREPLARAAYEARTGEIVDEIGFCLHDTLQTGVSPDGLIGANGLAEYKCPQPKTHLEYLRLEPGKCPTAYRWQVQGQLWVTGREWCDFASWCPDFPLNAQLVVRRVYRDEKAIQELEAEVIRFLEEVEREYQFIKSYTE